MQLQKIISKKVKENNLFVVAILKVIDENSRIRGRIRIRIRQSEVRIHISGSVPKCHGSATLINTSCFTQLEEGADSVGGELKDPDLPVSINNNNNNTSSNKNTSSQELSSPSLKVREQHQTCNSEGPVAGADLSSQAHNFIPLLESV